MKIEELKDAVYALSFTAGMNQRYHQRRESFWIRWDRAAKIAVGIVSFAGAVLTGATVTETSAAVGWWSLVVTIFAACLAVLINVLPFGDWARAHTDFLRRWSDLRIDVDTLDVRVSEATTELPGTGDSISRYQELLAKKNAINALEPTPKSSLLDDCWEDENEFRTGIRHYGYKKTGGFYVREKQLKAADREQVADSSRDMPAPGRPSDDPAPTTA